MYVVDPFMSLLIVFAIGVVAFLLGAVLATVIFYLFLGRLGRERSERSAGIADPNTGSAER